MQSFILDHGVIYIQLHSSWFLVGVSCSLVHECCRWAALKWCLASCQAGRTQCSTFISAPQSALSCPLIAVHQRVAGGEINSEALDERMAAGYCVATCHPCLFTCVSMVGSTQWFTDRGGVPREEMGENCCECITISLVRILVIILWGFFVFCFVLFSALCIIGAVLCLVCVCLRACE